jgi:hypothetical protein
LDPHGARVERPYSGFGWRVEPIDERSYDPDETLWAPFEVGDAEDSFHSRAQVHFATYRRLIRPNMIWGWWPEFVSNELQRFYELMVAGARPKLVLYEQIGRTSAPYQPGGKIDMPITAAGRRSECFMPPRGESRTSRGGDDYGGQLFRQ